MGPPKSEFFIEIDSGCKPGVENNVRVVAPRSFDFPIANSNVLINSSSFKPFSSGHLIKFKSVDSCRR